MLIGSKMLRIEKTHMMLAFLLVIVLWVGVVRKKKSISLSIVEVEYIVAESCCTQFLWMKQILKDYRIE